MVRYRAAGSRLVLVSRHMGTQSAQNAYLVLGTTIVSRQAYTSEVVIQFA